MAKQTAELGDSILSIAADNGFFWETVWNHPENAQLKALRKDPTLIAPGDSVFVPDLSKKTETRGTDSRHSFKVKGVPAKLRIQLRVLGEPRANEPYILNVDGTVFQGNTDGNGVVEQFIPPNAKGGELRLNGGKEVIPVRIGYLNPIDTLSGVQQRLNNLGIYCGSEDGEMNDDTQASVRRFQQKYGLPVTGDTDGATKAKLQQLHS